MKKIEIGGGVNKRTDGYECCDIRALPGIDHVCPADALPFPDKTVDEIFSRHVVEHFSLREFILVLVEWNRVLRNDGEVYIVCPNLLWHFRQILDGSHESLYNKKTGENDRYWGFGSVFGWQQDRYDVHKFGYYFELLKDVLEGAGFDEVENLTNTADSTEQAEHHLEVRAKKVNDFTAAHEHPLFDLFDVSH